MINLNDCAHIRGSLPWCFLLQSPSLSLRSSLCLLWSWLKEEVVSSFTQSSGCSLFHTLLLLDARHTRTMSQSKMFKHVWHTSEAAGDYWLQCPSCTVTQNAVIVMERPFTSCLFFLFISSSWTGWREPQTLPERLRKQSRQEQWEGHV